MCERIAKLNTGGHVEGFAIPYVDPDTGQTAETVTVVNSGFGLGQGKRHVPHSREVRRFRMVSTEVDLSAPLLSMCQVVQLSYGINYITVPPSYRGNPVHVVIGTGAMPFDNFNSLSAPMADFCATADSGPVTVKLPVNLYTVACICIMPQAYVQGYVDGVSVTMGYDPQDEVMING